MCTYKRANCFNSAASDSPFLTKQIGFTWNANPVVISHSINGTNDAMSAKWNMFSVGSLALQPMEHGRSMQHQRRQCGRRLSAPKLKLISLTASYRCLIERSSIKRNKFTVNATRRQSGRWKIATFTNENKNRKAINVRVYDGDNYVLSFLSSPVCVCDLSWPVNEWRNENVER